MVMLNCNNSSRIFSQSDGHDE